MTRPTIAEIHSDDDLNRIQTAMDVIGQGSNMGNATQNALTLLQLTIMNALEIGMETGKLSLEEISMIEGSLAETLRDLADNLENKKFRPREHGGE